MFVVFRHNLSGLSWGPKPRCREEDDSGWHMVSTSSSSRNSDLETIPDPGLKLIPRTWGSEASWQSQRRRTGDEEDVGGQCKVLGSLSTRGSRGTGGSCM